MKSFFYFINKVIKHYKRELEFQKWIQENRTTDFYIVVGGIGDTVWFMTFWEQYKKRNNLKEYKILTEPKYADMFNLYGEKNLILDKVDFLWLALKKTASSRSNKYSNIHPMIFPHSKSKKAVKVIEDYRSKIGIMMDDYFRFGCFDLSYEDASNITLPTLAETNYQIGTKKNVLLVPYTKSRINVPIIFWEKIAQQLNEGGYSVYTNVGTPNESAIKGTIPMSLKIGELPAVLKQYNFITISGRCGLADWLFVNECKQIVVHASMKSPQTRNEKLCSAIERKDSFKIMKRKLYLNEYNVEDLYFRIDNMNDDCADKTVSAVKKLKNYN